MSPNSRSAVALLVLFAASCDPGFDFRGHIVDSTGKPIVGATSQLTCPDSGVQFTAVSDREGRFAGGGIGWRPNTCVIEVRASGRPMLSLPLREHCAKPRGNDACLAVWLDVVLP